MLPLAVKKNKFGERVADISVTDYYAQIMEEVLEAHEGAIASKLTGHRPEFLYCNEAEELVDIITCCVTRLDIIDFEFSKKIKLVDLPRDFYRSLEQNVLNAHENAILYENVANNYKYYEGNSLVDVINLCITKLSHFGYDADARQKIYEAVNEKNRKRGYLED